jgi:ABC-type bacteriocin/lantibiotic exporter with double-glycine peptidase domain
MPLYVLLMVWSAKVLRPLFLTSRKAGKYASQQIDAIEGHRSRKGGLRRASLSQRHAQLSFSASYEDVSLEFHSHVVRWAIQTIGLLSTALFLWVGANKVMASQLTVGAFVASAR